METPWRIRTGGNRDQGAKHNEKQKQTKSQYINKNEITTKTRVSNHPVTICNFVT
jgi:hypothetical protein